MSTQEKGIPMPDAMRRAIEDYARRAGPQLGVTPEQMTPQQQADEILIPHALVVSRCYMSEKAPGYVFVVSEKTREGLSIVGQPRVTAVPVALWTQMFTVILGQTLAMVPVGPLPSVAQLEGSK